MPANFASRAQMSDSVNIALTFHVRMDDAMCAGCARLGLGRVPWPCVMVELAHHVEAIMHEQDEAAQSQRRGRRSDQPPR